jgi:hypothetical protein
MRLEELSKVIHTLASDSFKRGRIAFPTTCSVPNPNQSSASPFWLVIMTYPMHLLSLQKPNINLLPLLRKTKRAALDCLVDESCCSVVVEDDNRLRFGRSDWVQRNEIKKEGTERKGDLRVREGQGTVQRWRRLRL